MLRWIKRVFVSKPTAPIRRARLEIEQFEDRALPSAAIALSSLSHTLTINGTAGHEQVKISTVGKSLKVQINSGHVYSYSAHSVSKIVVEEGKASDKIVDRTDVPVSISDTQVTLLSASLTGSSSASGQVTLLPGGTSLQVSVTGLTANETYTVDVGSTSVGTITTDSTGAANATLTGISAAISSGTAVSIVDANGATDLSGSFASPVTTNPNPPSGPVVGPIAIPLSASLTSTSSSATGTIAFQPTQTAGSFNVAIVVSGLTADTTYTVDVGSTSIGTFTTDSTGAATTTLSSVAASVSVGTSVSIEDDNGATDLSGTLAPNVLPTPPIQPGPVSGSGSVPLVATLTGTSSGVSGTLSTAPSRTAGDYDVQVVVSGLAASSTYTVDIGTTAIGTFTTDSTGAANITLNGISASVASGTAASIVDVNGTADLSGTFAAPSSTTPPTAPGVGCDALSLVANLTGSSSSETATVTILPTQTGSVYNIQVVASGLSASSTYTIYVGGSSIGTVATDSTGAVNVTLNGISAELGVGYSVSFVDSSGNTDLTGSIVVSMGSTPGSPPSNPGGGVPSLLLTGTSGATGAVTLLPPQTSGSSSIEVTASGLIASSTYTVEIGTTTVGTFTTDGTGAVDTTLSGISAAIAPGTTISVLDTNGNVVLSGNLPAPIASPIGIGSNGPSFSGIHGRI